jgi:hypothetical protein
VGIDLHAQLALLRRRQVEGAPGRGEVPAYSGSRRKRWLLAIAGRWLANPARVARIGSWVRWLGRRWPALLAIGPLSRWGATRELPPLPRRSFQQEYAARSGSGAHSPAAAKDVRKRLPVAPSAAGDANAARRGS